MKVAAAIDGLRAQPWLAVGVFLGAFVVLILVILGHRRLFQPHPEITRKILHTGSGLLTLTFPFLFRDLWPVLLLTGGSALLIAVLKFSPHATRRLGRVVDGVERTTFGELYFPAAVAIVFWLARGQSPLLYCIPMLVLTLADATGALIGVRYGLTRFTGGPKSLEGSFAVAVVSFFCVHVPLLVWSEVGRGETLLIASSLALLVMLLEGSAWRGLDNLFLPIGGFFLLRAYLPLTAAELTVRLLVVVALVIAIGLSRRSTTLVDDSLLAGAFLCYVTWAVAGWQWLIPPAILFLGYAWFSPHNAQDGQRFHGVAAVLAVWAAALVWLTLSRTRDDTALVYPFTLVFACHMAIFGLSRLAHADRRRTLPALTLIAVVRAWLLLFLPFLIVQGLDGSSLALSLWAGACIYVAAAVFMRTEPDIRNTSLTLSRWIRQAASGALGSAAGWLVLAVLQRV